ncbi:uncharacterized protein Z518_02240 [Rhinocladiella mackenziei CBS 650.93]|uniref:Succinate dehydrogenase [ubiquinone] cytochrome b small subunit n=1 Tax=Rhinocladiella mackenziei CBS 650.93 TaxID=1442369 RepID=A0A0D2FZ87_9EURO|nr:uncharacterized protein Z518_02240 [Rhinocladiella mackenziei CBS 650.93]KIX07587.1 hypothetical protein Z518_02240 [Rhinocladiella mackenziei CBS 650.93]
MAAASRTAMLRQTQLLSSNRLFSPSTQLPRLLRPSPSIPSRQPLAPKWPAGSRFAPFSTTSQRMILPPGPQVIEGGVNQPAPFPKNDPLHGSYHWTFERVLSVGLVPLTITPFATGSLSPALDAALIFTLIVHSHLGFQSVIIDYIPIKRYPTARKLFMWALNLGTIAVAVGFYEFETNDVGVTEAMKRLWKA